MRCHLKPFACLSLLLSSSSVFLKDRNLSKMGFAFSAKIFVVLVKGLCTGSNRGVDPAKLVNKVVNRCLPKVSICCGCLCTKRCAEAARKATESVLESKVMAASTLQ